MLANAEMHWEFCTVCFTVLEKKAHSGGTATCKEQAKCDDCGRTYGDTEEHDFGTRWYNDTENHYRMCKCGEIAERESHIPDRDAPTETEPPKNSCGSVISMGLISLIALAAVTVCAKRKD